MAFQKEASSVHRSESSICVRPFLTLLRSQAVMESEATGLNHEAATVGKGLQHEEAAVGKENLEVIAEENLEVLAEENHVAGAGEGIGGDSNVVRHELELVSQMWIKMLNYLVQVRWKDLSQR